MKNYNEPWELAFDPVDVIDFGIPELKLVRLEARFRD